MSDLFKAKPGGCEEAALGIPFYAACNKPAVVMVGWPRRREGPYRMCQECAWHNTKNRGAVELGPYPPKEDAA